MHIHEIIIDGFKSYAQKTVVSGFDPHFNAITGLNGSGKSNILDSICFVLGISNLTQVCKSIFFKIIYCKVSSLCEGTCWKFARTGLQTRSSWSNKSISNSCF